MCVFGRALALHHARISWRVDRGIALRRLLRFSGRPGVSIGLRAGVFRARRPSLDALVKADATSPGPFSRAAGGAPPDGTAVARPGSLALRTRLTHSRSLFFLFVFAEDNLKQLHGIQESIQRMRQVNVQTLRLQVSGPLISHLAGDHRSGARARRNGPIPLDYGRFAGRDESEAMERSIDLRRPPRSGDGRVFAGGTRLLPRDRGGRRPASESLLIRRCGARFTSERSTCRGRRERGLPASRRPGETCASTRRVTSLAAQSLNATSRLAFSLCLFFFAISFSSSFSLLLFFC